MTKRVGTLAAVAACAALMTTACGLVPAEMHDGEWQPGNDEVSDANPRHTVAPDGWLGATGIGFTMDLPDTWNDLTREYKDEVPDTVLTSFFTVASELHGHGAFATLSTHTVDLDESASWSVFGDLKDWESRMTDPVFGPHGGIQTDAGGAGWWGSITGQEDGVTTTIHSIHLYHDTYELMVLIESYEGDEAFAEELLASLETVVFTAPAPVEGRHGVPEEVDGRWASYCGLVSADAQEWDYEFSPPHDATPWNCPEDVDYLGAWVASPGFRTYSVSARLEVGRSVSQVREARNIPSGAGTTLVDEAGDTYTVVSDEAVQMAAGGTASRIEFVVTTPDGESSQHVTYLTDQGAAGIAAVLVSAKDGEEPGDLSWVEPFVASIRADG